MTRLALVSKSMKPLSLITLLIILTAPLTFTGQTPSTEKKKEPLNTPIGGPISIFTTYDGTALRQGDFTFSTAYQNYDRDEAELQIVTSLFLEEHVTPLSFGFEKPPNAFRSSKPGPKPACSRRSQ
jgi:hypothetical protein